MATGERAGIAEELQVKSRLVLIDVFAEGERGKK